MKKWNVFYPTGSASVWEDELELFLSPGLDLTRIQQMAVGEAVLDQSDAQWYRVK